MATAIADVAAARRDYLDESGGRYVHVIADGGMAHAAATSPRRSRCGADAVMLGSPLARAARGARPRLALGHARPTTRELPRGARRRGSARSARWSRSCSGPRRSRTAR